VQQEEEQIWSTPWEIIRKLLEDILVRVCFAKRSAVINFVDGNDPKASLDRFPRMAIKEMLPMNL